MTTDSAKLYDAPAISAAYFFPQRARPWRQLAGGEMISIDLEVDVVIRCYWIRPLAGAPTLLYLHGNGESVADQLHHWPAWARQAGANIFFLDYPGYAESSGSPSLSACCQAARAALAHLLSRPESEVPGVVVMGRSVGSVFALDAAAHAAACRVQGLILESGVADLKLRLDMRVPYEQAGLDRQAIHAQLERDFDHRAKLQSLSCPVLVLHARGDSLVPCWNGQRLAKWAGDRLQRLVLFAAGDHNDIQWENEEAYKLALARFFSALES